VRVVNKTEEEEDGVSRLREMRAIRSDVENRGKVVIEVE
jgi:hypothetical protein